MSQEDLSDLFQRFDKNAKTTKKKKWWKNLETAVTWEERNNKSTEITSNDSDTFKGIINAFTELSHVKKPSTRTNTNHSITLFQCLFNINISNNGNNNGNDKNVNKFIESLCSASETFNKNEECMEILLQWSTETINANNIKFCPLFSCMGSIFLNNVLNNNDFLFKLERLSVINCESLLNSMSFTQLKWYLSKNKIKEIGMKINDCGDWYLQNILFKWIAKYYMNFKICLNDMENNNNSINYLKQIKSQFYKGLFTGIKNVSKLSIIKKEIKNKINNKLFDLTETKYKLYNGMNYIFDGIISDILLTYNDAIFPNNSVWTLQNIKQAWIYTKDSNNDCKIHFYGDFNVHIGTKLLYVCKYNKETNENETETENEKKNKFNASILWDGINKFISNENSMQCYLYFIDFESEKGDVLYDGTYNNISYIKFQSDSKDDFNTFIQDIVNILPKNAKVKMIDKGNKKKKIKKIKKKIHSDSDIEMEEEKEIKKKPKRRRRGRRRSNVNKKEEEEVKRGHIASCDIDLSKDDPCEGEYIKYRTRGCSDNDLNNNLYNGYEYGQIILKNNNNNNIDIEIIGEDGIQNKQILIDLNQCEFEIVKEEEVEKVVMEIKKRYNERNKIRPRIFGPNTPITETESMKVAKELSLPASDKNNKNKNVKKQDVVMDNIDENNEIENENIENNLIEKDGNHIIEKENNEMDVDGNDNEIGNNKQGNDINEVENNEIEMVNKEKEKDKNDIENNIVENEKDKNVIENENNTIENEKDRNEIGNDIIENENNILENNANENANNIIENEKDKNMVENNDKHEIDNDEMDNEYESRPLQHSIVAKEEEIVTIINENNNINNEMELDENNNNSEIPETEDDDIKLDENKNENKNICHIVENNNVINININENINKNEIINDNNIKDEQSEEKQQEIIVTDNGNNNNNNKTEVILVPDSDGSQQQQLIPNENNENENEFVSRPLQHPIIDNDKNKNIAIYKTPIKSRALPVIRSSKRNKRNTSTKRQSTVKWRKRQPLTLQNARKKNINNNKENININEYETLQEKHNRNKLQKQRIIEVNDSDIISTPHTNNNNNNNNNNNHRQRGTDSNKHHKRNDRQHVLREMNENEISDRFHSKDRTRKRKGYDTRDNYYNKYDGRGIKYNENINRNIEPPKKKRKTVLFKERGVQTEGPKRIDIKKIENELSGKFKILFENLFRDKMEELKNDNDNFKQFLRDKVTETTEIQNIYNIKMKQIQNDIFNKFKKDILKKWKDDVMDICDQLDEHGSNIQSQSDNNYNIITENRNINNQNDDIVREMATLLQTYNQN